MGWETAGETETLRRNIRQCNFVHHKSHMIWPGIESRKQATNCLCYDMNLWRYVFIWTGGPKLIRPLHCDLQDHLKIQDLAFPIMLFWYKYDLSLKKKENLKMYSVWGSTWDSESVGSVCCARTAHQLKLWYCGIGEASSDAKRILLMHSLSGVLFWLCPIYFYSKL